MISAIESQPAAHTPTSSARWKRFFPRAACFRAPATSNFDRSSRPWRWQWPGRLKIGSTWQWKPDRCRQEPGLPDSRDPVRRCAEKKAIISTHTINLQEQLTQKDLPMLEQVLPVDFRFTMLKGRANYLAPGACRRPCNRPTASLPPPKPKSLKRIHEWSKPPTTQPLGFQRGAGRQSLGPGLLRARLVLPQDLRTPIRMVQRPSPLLLSAGPVPDSFLRRAGAQSHAFLYAARGDGGGKRRRHPFQE